MEHVENLASDKLLNELLHNNDWQQLWLKLEGRCIWLLRNRFGVKWPFDTVMEFSRKSIGDVIDKIFVEKSRKWNTARYPEFEEFIISVIDSHIYNQIIKSKKEISYTDDFGANKYIPKEPDAQASAMTTELRNQVYTELESSGANDEELFIFECLADGMEKPEEIRNELGISSEEFHNAWRRFKRRRKAIQEKLAANGY